MEHTELVRAFQHLGTLCRPGTRIVIAGGSALILGGHIRRGTVDVDVLFSEPRLSELKAVISEVAREQYLPPEWLNDSAKAWLDVLPPDFETRVEEVGTFGSLRVQRLSRMDLVLMKFFSFRAGDLDDLSELAPTVGEIEFVRSQLERISRVYPAKAHRMELYLDQGASRIRSRLRRTTEQDDE